MKSTFHESAARALAALALQGAAMLACAPAFAQDIRGAGATLPAPVYEAWARAYEQATGTHVRYDPIGSGLGTELVEQGQVDFGASDAPLSPKRLADAHLRQVPVVIGAVVAVVNIAGIARGELVLDAGVLSAIYRGRIRNWRDPAIAALNPGLALPDANITVVHRADASGTTWLWSHYLADNDAHWNAEVGTGTTLAWPTGTAGLGNEGVASLVRRTRAAIGYVGYAYAREHRLSDVALPSHDGPVVRASRATFEAAVAAAHWSSEADLVQALTDEPGPRSWPLVGASYALIPDGVSPPDSPAAAVRGRVIAFLNWALSAARPVADELGYIALPPQAALLAGQALRRDTP